MQTPKYPSQMRPSLQSLPPLLLPPQLLLILLTQHLARSLRKKPLCNSLRMSQNSCGNRRSIASILPFSSRLGDLLYEIP